MWTILGVAVLLLAVTAIVLWDLRKRSRRPAKARPISAAEYVHSFDWGRVTNYRAADQPKQLFAAYVLFPAPKVNGLSLRDWLVHHVNRDGVWAEVVAEFYTEAASDPDIFPYFAHTDMDRLKRHFLSTLLILVHTGLTVGALDAMRERHEGLGITGPVFDRTVQALAGVLARKGVPAGAIADLGPVVSELRAVIVEEAS